MVHALQKKSTKGISTPRHELVRGSGNAFADFGAPDASLHQLRAILVAEIVKTLDAERLTVRDAEVRTGVAAADFPTSARSSSTGRPLRILEGLNQDVRVKISVAPRAPQEGRLHGCLPDALGRVASFQPKSGKLPSNPAEPV